MIQLGGPPGLSPSTRAKGVGMCIYAQWSEEMMLVDFVHFCDYSYILYGIVLCQNSLSSQRRLLNNSRIRIFAWITFLLAGSSASRAGLTKTAAAVSSLLLTSLPAPASPPASCKSPEVLARPDRACFSLRTPPPYRVEELCV